MPFSLAARRGLSTRWVGVTVIRWIMALGGVVFVGVYVVILLAGHPVGELLIHSLTIVLIALAIYSWVVLPLAAGVAVTVVAAASLISAWVVTRSPLIACDVAAFVALLAVASVRQRRARGRLQRLKQQLDDLDEGLYVKAQAVELGQQNRDALQRKLTRYQQLHTVAESLSHLLKLEAIAQLTVERTFELIGKSDVCLLFLVERQRQELALYASKKAAPVAVIRTKQGDQFDHYVLRTQRPLLVNDVRRDFRFSVVGASDRPVASVIACPLMVGENAEGVLRLDSAQPGAYNQDDLRFLDILLDLVETALANARLFAQTQQLALTDGLTECYRRQPFLDQLSREVARASRAREPFSILMLDIDDFKRYNDTFGHTAGDLVLKTVAEIVRATIPPDGMCARYGGEEFAILLPKATREHGADIAGRIRQTVEAQIRASANGSGRRVTVSLGVAAFPDDAQSELELIRRSDERLYQAKRSGKNQVWSS